MNEIKIIQLKNEKYIDSFENKDIDLFLFDNDQKNLNFSIELTLMNNANVNLNILSINNNFLKKINIIINHKGNNSSSFCNIRTLNNNSSNSNFIVYSNIDMNLNNIVTKQNVEGILLSNSCQILALPSLNVNSHTAKAFHSVNIGKINPNYLFYLMTKKLSLSESYKMILKSYFQSFLDNSIALGLDPKEIDKEISKILSEVSYGI